MTEGQTRLVLVEHESGLEILYIAGSIASLISLVPLVLQVWGSIRHGLARTGAGAQQMEIRRLDGGGQLIEEHIHESRPSALVLGDGLITRLIGMDLGQIQDRMRSLTLRVEALEKAAPTKSKPRKSRGTKATAPVIEPNSADAKLAHLLKPKN